MTLRSSLLAYLACTAALLALDLLWLRLIAFNAYRDGIGHLLAPEVNGIAAGLFYLMFPVGLVIFAISPTLSAARSGWHAARLGALFGLFAYATYDLTNLATLQGWPLSLSLMDTAWGSFASALAALAGRAAASFTATTPR